MIKEKGRLLVYFKFKLNEFVILEVFLGFIFYLKDIILEMFNNELIKIVGKVSIENLILIYSEIVWFGLMDNIVS